MLSTPSSNKIEAPALTCGNWPEAVVSGCRTSFTLGRPCVAESPAPLVPLRVASALRTSCAALLFRDMGLEFAFDDPGDALETGEELELTIVKSRLAPKVTFEYASPVSPIQTSFAAGVPLGIVTDPLNVVDFSSPVAVAVPLVRVPRSQNIDDE